MPPATNVPAAIHNLATALRARPGLDGVGVHTVILDAWTDSEAIVLTQTSAPQAFSFMDDQGGVDETVTQSGFAFAELAGDSDSDADDASTRAGQLLAELLAQVQEDSTLGGALADRFAEPLLTQANWIIWRADQDGTGVLRARVDWTLTWTAEA
jgi:hypothetical protein